MNRTFLIDRFLLKLFDLFTFLLFVKLYSQHDAELNSPLVWPMDVGVKKRVRNERNSVQSRQFAGRGHANMRQAWRSILRLIFIKNKRVCQFIAGHGGSPVKLHPQLAKSILSHLLIW